MAFFVFVWRRDTMDDSIQIMDQLKVSHLLNWNSSSLTDGLLGRRNYRVNLSRGTGVKFSKLRGYFCKFHHYSLGVWGSRLQLTSA